MTRKALTGFVTLLALTLASTGCSSMKRGSMASVQPITQNERVGSVYLLRGWIGIFSTGIDSLGQEINAKGIHAEVFQESQSSALASAIIKKYKDQPNHEPIVIVGHSYGADGSIDIARRLAEHDIQVDLVVTLDPVTPKKAPSNIRVAYNLYQSSALDNLPWLRGIPLTPDTPGPRVLKNMNIRTDRTDLLEPNLDHFNIEKKPKIHADVIAQVMNTCPPRSVWAMRRVPATPVAIASTPTRAETPHQTPAIVTICDTAPAATVEMAIARVAPKDEATAKH